MTFKVRLLFVLLSLSLVTNAHPIPESEKLRQAILSGVDETTSARDVQRLHDLADRVGEKMRALEDRCGYVLPVGRR